MHRFNGYEKGEALKQHLELLGATVAGPAATTAEAREVILGGRPDIALVDFHLRGENSYTLIAQLRQEDIHVIMLSGESPAQALLERGNDVGKAGQGRADAGTLETNCKNTTKIVSVWTECGEMALRYRVPAHAR